MTPTLSTTPSPSVHLLHLWSDFMRAPQQLPHWTLNPFHAISLTDAAALICNMFTHFTLSSEHVHQPLTETPPRIPLPP